MTFTDLIKIHRDINTRNRRQTTPDRRHRTEMPRTHTATGPLFDDWASI